MSTSVNSCGPSIRTTFSERISTSSSHPITECTRSTRHTRSFSNSSSTKPYSKPTAPGHSSTFLSIEVGQCTCVSLDLFRLSSIGCRSSLRQSIRHTQLRDLQEVSDPRAIPLSFERSCRWSVFRITLPRAGIDDCSIHSRYSHGR